MSHAGINSIDGRDGMLQNVEIEDSENSVDTPDHHHNTVTGMMTDTGEGSVPGDYGTGDEAPVATERDSTAPRTIVHESLSSMSDLSNVFSTERFRLLKNYVSQGEKKFKLIAMSISALLVVRGLLGFFRNIFTLYFFGAVVDLIFFCVGGLCIAYEYDERKLPIALSTYIDSEFHIFSRPFGRSLVLTSTGLLMLQQPWGLDTILGVFVCGGGGYIFYHMRNAEIALAGLKKHVSSENELRALFDRCDTDNNGTLDAKEVALVCRELGTSLEGKELQCAINLLDRNNSGVISFDDFREWYSAHT